MSYLKEQLDAIDRNIVIEDTVHLIDHEVASKSGISGAVLKGGYKAVKKLKGGRMIHKAVDHLLDEFTQSLAPMHEEFLDQDTSPTFASFLTTKSSVAADALLSITDGKAERSEHKIVRATYKKLRGQAKGHVVDALPGVGRLIDRHVPRT